MSLLASRGFLPLERIDPGTNPLRSEGGLKRFGTVHGRQVIILEMLLLLLLLLVKNIPAPTKSTIT